MLTVPTAANTVGSTTGRVLALLALIVSFAIPAAAQADVTPVSSGSTTGLTGPITFSLTVPAGNDRFLAVGISTTVERHRGLGELRPAGADAASSR